MFSSFQTFFKSHSFCFQVESSQLQSVLWHDFGWRNSLPSGHTETFHHHHEHERDSGTDNVSLYFLADAASKYPSFILESFISHKPLQNHLFLLALSAVMWFIHLWTWKWWVTRLWLTPLRTKTFSLKEKLVPIFGNVAPLFIYHLYLCLFSHLCCHFFLLFWFCLILWTQSLFLLFFMTAWCQFVHFFLHWDWCLTSLKRFCPCDG